MASAHVYQILNHYTPRDALDAGFRVLDNSANETARKSAIRRWRLWLAEVRPDLAQAIE